MFESLIPVWIAALIGTGLVVAGFMLGMVRGWGRLDKSVAESYAKGHVIGYGSGKNAGIEIGHDNAICEVTNKIAAAHKADIDRAAAEPKVKQNGTQRARPKREATRAK